ncbi:hypothetical protein Tco_0345770 [Tanacetum coccineum]|uniref:Uncharacterized protein n=1 Tax=Tanacetum coccineum TaxID=301880 RepID=A0ABQ5A4S3_9ASTR
MSFCDVPSETPKPRKGKRVRKAKSYGRFSTILVRVKVFHIGHNNLTCYSIEEDSYNLYEAMLQKESSKEDGKLMETIGKFKLDWLLQMPAGYIHVGDSSYMSGWMFLLGRCTFLGFQDDKHASVYNYRI